MSAVTGSPFERVWHVALLERGVPEHLHGDLLGYLCAGLVPGHFLRAALENNFVLTLSRAEDLHTTRDELFRLAMFLRHDAPPDSWGSPKAVTDWCKKFPKLQQMLEAMRGW